MNISRTWREHDAAESRSSGALALTMSLLLAGTGAGAAVLGAPAATAGRPAPAHAAAATLAAYADAKETMSGHATAAATAAAGSTTPSSQAGDERPIVVTVDDLPIAAGSLHQEAQDRERVTRGMLAALEKHRIRAVGLVTWNNVHGPADQRLLGSWLASGHELGNHSRSHLHYSKTPFEAYRDDIEKGRDALDRYLKDHGKTSSNSPKTPTLRFFRFPFLEEGDTPEKLSAMRAYLQQSGQRNLPVTIDDQDWSFEEPWVKARRAGDARAKAELTADYLAMFRIEVRHHEETGDALFGRRLPQILLLHANEVGAANWDALFTWLEQTGHRFASADEVLTDAAFSEPHSYTGPYGSSLWDRIADRKRMERVRADLASLLERQSAAWSRGDLDAFCSSYAPDALFISPSGITRGRDAVLARYRAKYPDKAAMGTLALELIEIRPATGTEITLLDDAVPAGVHAASAAARWTLTYPDKPAASGLTLIVFQRQGKDWVIVQDASM